MNRPLSYNPATGLKETFHFDHATGECHIKAEVDVQPILDVTKAMNNEFRGPGGGPWKGGFLQHVASVPMIIVQEKLIKTGRIDSDAERRKFLNAPEQKCFRTRPGVV